MPMTGANMANTMQGIGAFPGDSWPDICSSVGDGAIDNLVGKPFTTSDTGSTPGAGVGTGVGLSGVSDSAISADLFSALQIALAATPEADSLPDICDAVAQSWVLEIALALLSTVHAPPKSFVFAGGGILEAGSIVVDGTAMGEAIKSAGILAGFVGDSWPDIAEIIGDTLAASLDNAIGNVVITGSPVPPGAPVVPGTGQGDGTLS